MKDSNLPNTKMLPTNRGYELAYQHISAEQSAKNKCGIIFLHGHGSDMLGSKAEVIMNWAIDKKIQFTRFDFFGHGQTGGDIMSATIGHWIEDACNIIDNITDGKQILVGSSLGGWIMLTLCKYRLKQIDSLIGIAAAPDFTKRLIWDTLEPGKQDEFRESGVLNVPDPYSTSYVHYPYQLIQEAEKHLVLESPIEFNGRVILHHGLCDEEVPWQTSLEIAQKVKSDKVQVHLDKTATHRYSQKEQLGAIVRSLENLMSADLKEY